MSDVRRRKFITLLAGAAAWPLAARAQQTGERVRRIGVLMNAAATETIPQSYVAEFVQGLRQLGWIEGRNLRIDVRWNAGDAALARIYAAQRWADPADRYLHPLALEADRGAGGAPSPAIDLRRR
jgi:putative ABC transport system substrate-binding protein